MVSVDLFVLSLIPVLKLLLVSTIGSFLALDRVNILTEDASNHLNNIVFYVFAPCLIAVNLAETVTVETMISLWFMPVNIIFTYIIGSVFGWIVIQITGAPSKLRGLIVGCCSAGNLGNLPIIIIPAICKEKASPFGDPETCYTFGMAYATLSMAAGGVCTWLYVYNVMQMYSSKESCGVEAYVRINETNGFGVLSESHLDSCKEPLLESVSLNRDFTNELAVHHGSSHVPICVKFKQTLKMFEEKVNLKRLFAPSTIAVIIGFGIGLLPQIRSLVIGDTAPLRVIGDSTALLGAGTIPVLTLILGGNLVNCSKEPEIKMPVMIGIIVARYVLMPLSGVLIIKLNLNLNLNLKSNTQLTVMEDETPITYNFEEEEEQLSQPSNSAPKNNNTDHGWQTVVNHKRHRKPAPKQSEPDLDKFRPSNTKSNVFSSIEEHADERRRKIVENQKMAAAEAEEERLQRKLKHHNIDDDDYEYDNSDNDVAENGKADEPKKPKVKKPKKIKVTVAEAGAKIDAADLSAFLVDITGSYESQQDIQLMRFADYFARAFSAVKNAEFPWTKLFKESTVAKMADIPLNDVPEAVYKTSTDWINKRSSEALGTFILWSLDTIFADLAIQQGPAKGSKKVAQQGSSKAQVAIFVVLAMALRRKPDVLLSLLPKLREDPKYQGQDKLPVMLWVVAQAAQGDLAVGMYSWVHNLFPIISGKSVNTQSRDLVLQSLERILSAPKARSILLNGAVRKGERLVPPSSLELLMRATFPPASARIKATERFEAAYPILKELALAGTPGSKAMKQATQQIFSFALKAAGEGIPELSNEAASVGIWCLTENPDCFKLWDKIYLDNVGASVSVLKKLSDEWKVHSAKYASLDPMREAIKSFRQKNEKALSKEEDAGNQALFRAADKYCKVILGRLSRGHGCVKFMLVAVVAVSVGAFVSSPNMEAWDWNKLSVLFSSYTSF